MLDFNLFEQIGAEIVSALASRMRSRGLMLADFPRLTDDGHTRRMNSVLSGRGKGRVSLGSALKKFVRQHYPDFKFAIRQDDDFRFEKSVTDNFNLLLTFERIHHFGLGKAFTVHIGCSWNTAPGERVWWKHSLLSFFDRGKLEWTYGLHDDLEACLEEVAVLLRLVLPEYEATWLAVHTRGNTEVLSSMPDRGPLSFREAADVAYSSLSVVFPQYSTVCGASFGRKKPLYSYSGLISKVNAPGVPGRFIPEVGWLVSKPDASAALGRLTPRHSWFVRFADTEANRTITVCVPYCGRLEFMLSSVLPVSRNNVHHLARAEPSSQESLTLPPTGLDVVRPHSVAAAWHELADSPEIMSVAAASGGNDFLRKHPDCSIILNLFAEFSEPPVPTERWNVHYLYLAKADANRADLSFDISARDLKVTHCHSTVDSRLTH